jgi:hypothetical protein
MSKRFSKTGGQEAVVAVIPACDFCKQGGTTTDATHDGATNMGPWAFMCEPHFQQYGVGLGEGRGQRLFTEDIA